MQSSVKQRLDALDDLCKREDFHLVPVPFLVDRLNATTIEREQAAILRLMGKREEPLLEEILEDVLNLLETFAPPLINEVVRSLAVTQVEEVLDLLSCLLEDFEESRSEDPASWEGCIPAEVLFALLTHPHVLARWTC